MIALATFCNAIDFRLLLLILYRTRNARADDLIMKLWYFEFGVVERILTTG